MAFRHPAPAPPQVHAPPATEEEVFSTPASCGNGGVRDLQEWILFSPSQVAPSTAAPPTNKTSYTADFSHLSASASLGSRSGQRVQNNNDHGLIEDGELDSLDDGLQAFRDPAHHSPTSTRGPRPVLPAHDGLGTFPSSRPSVHPEYRRNEQSTPKRKFEGNGWARSTSQKRVDLFEELDSRISEDKRLRIEQWRIEQSQTLPGEIERKNSNENRRRSAAMQGSADQGNIPPTLEPAHGDVSNAPIQGCEEVEPLWRRIARKFIQDVIGIDEPLLSVIVGETLPVDICRVPQLGKPSATSEFQDQLYVSEDIWPDRLLHRLARELGVLMHKVSAHRDDIISFPTCTMLDYAGMPITDISYTNRDSLHVSSVDSASILTPLFSPTIEETAHRAFSAADDGVSQPAICPEHEGSDNEKMRKGQEYWERELDVKMVFHFLKSRFYSGENSRDHDVPASPTTVKDNSVRRADVIRRHHPLVPRARQPSLARLRRESNFLAVKHSISSCASESVRSGFRHSIAKGGVNSHEYWDIGGSIGSGSVLASGGMMGVWGEV